MTTLFLERASRSLAKTGFFLTSKHSKRLQRGIKIHEMESKLGSLVPGPLQGCLLRCLWGPLGGLLGCLWGLLESLWAPIGAIGVPLATLGPQICSPGASFAYLLGSFRVLGVSWGLSGAFLSDFSAIWGRFVILYRIVSYSMVESSRIV